MLGDWRLGAVLQGGSSGAMVEALNSSASSVDYGGGVYGGTQWGDTRLSLGALYTRHDIHSTRDVAFPGFTETLTASYGGNTAQAFATLSHEVDLGALSLTPFVGVAQVRSTTDGFVESGGAAALTVAANVIDATFTSLGLGLSHQYALPDDMLLTANVSLGWRHGFGDTPSSIHSLSGGTAFSVIGAPLVRDVVLLSAGLNLDVSVMTTIDLNYDGEFAPGRQTHALKAVWATRF
jgi:outer membrane autotransporter protein